MVDVRPAKRAAAAGPSTVQKISIENQIRQRQAVAAVQERLRVHVASQTFGGCELRNTRVLVAGEYYDVDAFVLAKLRAGSTPAELELEPADCWDDC